MKNFLKRKSQRNKNTKKRKLLRAGALPENYVNPLWGDIQVSVFPLSDENLRNFSRLERRQTETDCVVNAMQVIGIFDSFSANLFRLLVRDLRLEAKLIENILELRFRRKYKFIKMSNLSQMMSIIVDLPTNMVLFCGVEFLDNNRHVFLIGKDRNDGIVKIDAQRNPKICMLANQECMNEFANNVRHFFLLFQYPNSLTLEEQREIGILDSDRFSL